LTFQTKPPSAAVLSFASEKTIKKMEQSVITGNYNRTLQQPLHSGFSAASTAADINFGIDLRL